MAKEREADHDRDDEPEDDDDVFVFRVRILYQEARWPATVWSAFAAVLSVCLTTIIIAALLSWAPSENVEAMSSFFHERKPTSTEQAPKLPTASPRVTFDKDRRVKPQNQRNTP
jgi:hypothetical protein